MIHGHGGNIYSLAERLGCRPSDILDMSSNVNPLGPPEGLTDFLTDSMSSILALPEVDAQKVVAAFSKHYRIRPDRVLAGNGTTQFIYSVPLALRSRKALILGPAYADYADACQMHGVSYEYFFSKESEDFMPDLDFLFQEVRGCDTVFICNPNNPTGVLIPAGDLETLFRTSPDVRFVVDESYLPFVANHEASSMIRRALPNVIVLNSMSKIFRVPGLRIGFLAASEDLIRRFIPYMLPWSVNSLAQAAVIYLMDDQNGADQFIGSSAAFLASERNRMTKALDGSDVLKLYPSHTSFILGKLYRHTAADVCDYLSRKKILIRNCENFRGLSERHIRISLKTEEVNSLLASELTGLSRIR